MGDQNKAQSVFNFCKRHELPKTTQLQLSSVAAKNNAVALRKENLPSRCFKRSSNKKLKSEQALIQCTLLEFGKKGDILQLLSEGPILLLVLIFLELDVAVFLTKHSESLNF